MESKELKSEYENLLEEFISFTEVNLATLGLLQMKKSTAKCAIERQREICENMLWVCRKKGVTSEMANQFIKGKRCFRVKDVIENDWKMEGVEF